MLAVCDLVAGDELSRFTDPKLRHHCTPATMDCQTSSVCPEERLNE